MRLALRAAVCAALLAQPAIPALAQTRAGAAPLVIGHRGASGERPEHTASSYRLAIAEGADFIEPDLVASKDGALFVRHENEIGATTDVAAHPEFADRKTTKTIDGMKIEGWFTEDFTLAELRTLKARERLPQLRPGNAAFDGRDGLMTFAEVVALARTEGKAAGRVIGVYPEMKHPTYFASIGLPLEGRLAAALKAEGLTRKTSPVVVQCFETGALRRFRRLSQVRTVFLMAPAGSPADAVAGKDARSYQDWTRPAALKELATFVDGIGPDKLMILPRDAAQTSLPPTTLVADAHAAGLMVHPYTVRAENLFLPADLRKGADPAAHGDVRREFLALYGLGVDGLFSDFPGEAVKARAEFQAGRR